MSKGKMAIDTDAAKMLALSSNRRRVRVDLPPVPLEGYAPLKIHMEWDAETVDGVIDRLLALRAQMLPAPKGN